MEVKYLIENSALLNSTKMEVAKVAASAYADDGTPLYEGINIFSSDEAIVSGFFTDAIHEIVRRLYDVCMLGEDPIVDETPNPDEGVEDGIVGLAAGDVDLMPGRPCIIFSVPDFNGFLRVAAIEAVTRYIVLFACACWCRMKYPSLGEDYGNKAASEMERLVGIIKGRRKPSRN